MYFTLGYYLYTESNGRNYGDNAMLRTVNNYNDNQQYCLRFVLESISKLRCASTHSWGDIYWCKNTCTKTKGPFTSSDCDATGMSLRRRSQSFTKWFPSDIAVMSQLLGVTVQHQNNRLDLGAMTQRCRSDVAVAVCKWALTSDSIRWDCGGCHSMITRVVSLYLTL